jgi:hypothetical protein
MQTPREGGGYREVGDWMKARSSGIASSAASGITAAPATGGLLSAPTAPPAAASATAK